MTDCLCLKTLEGHEYDIRSVFVKDNLIISCSYQIIKIWNIDSGKCLKTLKGHTSYVNSVFVKDNLIISGSDDGTIRIWDINSGSCLKSLECQTYYGWSLFVQNNLIISGSDDKTIKIIPISLFPGELGVFQQVIVSFNLAQHLEREILDYLGC
jgi:WD40 repeat protein